MNPEEIVVGDLVKLKAGDGIPTDGVIFEVRRLKHRTPRHDMSSPH